jgi:hypothetical protein
MQDAGTTTTARVPWLLVAAAVVAGISVGALAVVSAPAALALAALPLVVIVVRSKLSLVAQATLVFCVGVPVLYIGSANSSAEGNPLLRLPLGSASPPLQVVLPILIALAVAVLADGRQWARLWAVVNGGMSGIVVLWVVVAGLLMLYGAARNGVMAAGRDFLYTTAYVWVVVPVMLFGRMRERATPFFLRLVVMATAMSAGLAVLIFAVRPLRALFVPGTGVVQYTRVGFSTGSIYLLALPVCLLMVARRGTSRRAKALWWTSSLLMLAAMSMSQGRTAIAVLAMNVALVMLIPGLRGVGIERARMIVAALIVAAALAVALITASVLGYQQAKLLPQELSQRLTSITAFSRVDTFQGRMYTNAVAFRRWFADPGTVVRGEGLGAQVRYYDPVTRRAFDEGPFIDNVWASLAVKGGLLAVGAFAAVLVASFAAFVRAARRAADPLNRVIWWALALSFPGLVLESTAMTNHLLAVPSTVVAVATFVAAADLCALRRGLPDEGGAAG